MQVQVGAQVAAQPAPAASNVTVKELLDWLMPRLDAAGHSEMVQAQVRHCSVFVGYGLARLLSATPGCFLPWPKTTACLL